MGEIQTVQGGDIRLIIKRKKNKLALFQGVMGLLTEKGWNKLSNHEEVKEVEVRALFNMIDKDNSGELSLEVCIYSNNK